LSIDFVIHCFRHIVAPVSNSEQVDYHVDTLEQRHPIDTRYVLDEYLVNGGAKHARMSNDCDHAVATLRKRRR
jgi:hypothetical protein